MADVLSTKQRSYCMSRIRGKNTKPEIILRKEIWSTGLKYRIKNKLPGNPDIVFPRFKIAVFVDGCFWHRCPKHFVEPKSNRQFWTSKIDRNVFRDKENNKKLDRLGWKVIRVWEHEINDDLEKTAARIAKACLEE